MSKSKEFYVEDGNLDIYENFKVDESSDNKLIYEVIRVIDGVPLFLEGHLDRFENSFKIEGINFPYKDEKIEEYINTLIDANKIKDGNIKIIYECKYETIKVYQIPHSYPTKAMYKEGVKTILYVGERRNPNSKVVDNNFRGKVNEEIKANNAYEAILVGFDNKVSEGSKSNIFFVKNNELYTSEIKDVLPGITRKEIIEVANENNINVNETTIFKDDVDSFEAAFICGTSPKILPIKTIDNMEKNVNNELLNRLITIFNDKINQYIMTKNKKK